MISDLKVEEVRDRSDIVELISTYLTLKKTGANYQGLCPFHAEKTPSFSVSPARQTFHCFGCGVGGDVFEFLMRINGLSFPEAVIELGTRIGIEVEERKLSSAEEKRQREKEVLYRINEVAAEFYHTMLLEKEAGAQALKYLQRRGYNRETARKYQLGFAPPGWNGLVRHLEEKGFQGETCRKLGLIRTGKMGKGDYDFFRNRLMFPIINNKGKVVAFGGRILDDSSPKYLNSPETEVYRKGQILYGLYQSLDAIRREGECILVEGYFDLLAVVGAGFKHTTATCGTAITQEHTRSLRRYTNRVLLLFDQDEAGQKAAFRGMEVLLKEGMSVAMVALDEKEDPDSFLKKRGKEAFRKRLADARPALTVFMETVLSQHGEDPESRARGINLILNKLKLLPSSVERRLYLQDLADKTGLDVHFLETGEKNAGGSYNTQTSPERKNAILPSRPTSPETAAVKNQDLLLILLATDTGIRDKVAKKGTLSFFPDIERRIIAEGLLNLNYDASSSDEVIAALDWTANQEKIVRNIFQQDIGAYAEKTEEIFRDICLAVNRRQRKERSSDLTRLIREAEKAGDNLSLTAYLAEKMELDRRR